MRRSFSAKYRHRVWGIALAIPATLTALFSFGYFIACIVNGSTFYLPAAITFLIPALALGLPSAYLLRGRGIDPRPAVRKEAATKRQADAAALREARTAEQQEAVIARREELTIKYKTAEAQRQAAVAQREAAQAEAQTAAARAAEVQATAASYLAVPSQPTTSLPSAATASSMTASPPAAYAAASTGTPTSAQLVADEIRIRRIAGSVRASGILWLVLGILQVLVGAGFAFAAGLTLALVLIGIWNIIAASGRLTSVKLIMVRDSTIPPSWDGIAGLIVIGIANFLIGGLIGVALVIFDFVIRDRIIKNRALFTQTATAS